MPKLENFDNFIKIDGVPSPRNAITYSVMNGDTVALYIVSEPVRILNRFIARFDEWTNGADKPYDSLLELTTDLDNYLFSSVSLQSVVDEVRVTNELLKNMFVYLKVISNQLESLEEDGGNFEVKELKNTILN